MTKEIIKIIFFGDIVGKPGRYAVRDFLANTCENYDFVIANVENASHGFGLTEKNYNEFKEYGVHAMTCGNHIWDKKDIYTYIDTADCLIRPINYPKGTKGVGSRIFDMGDFKIGVINVLGRVFMNLVDSQWEMVTEEIKKIKEVTPIVVLDFHAEATAEKICFGKYCSELGLSAFFGTHTHVQTADENITNGMAYITDAGFCGASDGVIGMEYQTSLSRFLTCIPERYDVAEGKSTQVCAVEVEIDSTSGKALAIKRILSRIDNIEEESKSEEKV
ncbi:MAG: YmdB family metallophosphoesterase [Muribaculaceae bacterium]|nr:YmdB family metallophosphoesterase [Muribaculaceae bacterium]